jgi:catechol 2,3-dioxygenase-like lactoylglutathione lyase family enzyme
MIMIDHIGLMARDADASARFLAEILGLADPAPVGPDGDIYQVVVAESPVLLFFPAQSVLGQHIAFRVDRTTFDGVVNRLRGRGIIFGNDPEDQTNMQTSDVLGGHGRVFFRDPNGHLVEVMA